MFLIAVCFGIIFNINILTGKEICSSSYTYLKETGKCYKIINEKGFYQHIVGKCKSNTQNTLSRIKTKTELRNLEELYVQSHNSENIWIDAKYNRTTKQYQWNSDKQIINKTIFSKTMNSPFERNFMNTEMCAVVKISFSFKNNEYKYNSILGYDNCNTTHNAGVCEYSTPSCETEAIENFNKTTMTMYPNVPYIDNEAKVVCLHGYFKKNDKMSLFNCVMFGEFARWEINKTVSSGAVEDCQEVKCTKVEYHIKNVVGDDSSYFTKDSYKFGEFIDFKCARGYVNYRNKTSTESKLICEQSAVNEKEGFWMPATFTPCVPVMCDQKQMLNMKPKRSKFAKARHRVTNKEFSAEFQLSKFPYFDNIVDIQCEDGLIFPDRKITKKIICDLKNNSKVVGNWIGYVGTQLPLPDACEDVTCLYEPVIPQPSQHLQSVFEITKVDSFPPINVTSHSGSTYKYNTKIKFFCNPGFTTGNKETTQLLVCSKTGNWLPRLRDCIGETKNLETGNKKKYVPAPTESKLAQEVGAIVIIILVIFLSIIVILDLSTITRDIKLLKKNLKLLKEYTSSQSRNNKKSA